MTDLRERLRRISNPVWAHEAVPLCAEADDEIERLSNQLVNMKVALETLLKEAESFSVSGVYFAEECMGHKGPAMARAALARLTDD